MNFHATDILPHHQSMIALVMGALLLLGLAPKLESVRTAVAGIGILVCAGAVGFALFAAREPRFAVVAVCTALAISFLLLRQAELAHDTQTPEAGALLLIGGVGAITLVTAKGLIELALGVEMISLVAAILTAIGKGSRPLEAGFKYFVLTAVTFATLLFGAALVFLGTGKLGFPIVAAMGYDGARWLAIGGLALMSVGVGYKLALVPVHFGALDAYTAGPSSFVGFVMVASKLGGVIALAKIAAAAGGALDVLLLIIALATLWWGVFGSWAQDELRRLLAYSAVAHAGFLGLAAASGDSGLRAGAFYVAGYGAGALLCFACLAGRGTGPLPLRRLDAEPLGPVRALGLIIGLLSLAGVPPLPGFWVKLAVLKAAYAHFGALPTAIAALGGVIGVVYYLRPLPELMVHLRSSRRGPIAATIAVCIAGVLVVVLGLFPSLAWTLAP